MNRIAGAGTAGGLGALIAWAWNLRYPEMQMPAEVAAIVGGVLHPIVEDVGKVRRALLGRWLDAE